MSVTAIDDVVLVLIFCYQLYQWLRKEFGDHLSYLRIYLDIADLLGVLPLIF